MLNLFGARRRRSGARPTTRTRRTVPGPDVMVGVEYLDHSTGAPAGPPPPEVAVCGLDPRVPGEPGVPRMQVVVCGEVGRPDSVDGLLDIGPEVRVRRLTVDVRGFRDVLESRGGWNLLAAVVRDPADRVTNAVFRAAITGPAAGERTAGVLEGGDVDCEVSIVGEGDTVAGRCHHELGRARLTLTAFLGRSERLTRRLAEALARPRDRGTRRCLEQALGDVLAEAPLRDLLERHSGAPYCSVPGAWDAAPAAFTPPPRVAVERVSVPAR